MTLSYSDLATKLPAGAVEFVGASEVKVNFSLVTGDEIDLNSSCVEGIAKLLDAASTLTKEVNELRQNNGQEYIYFIQKENGYGDGSYRFVADVKTDPETYLDNLLDPTEQTQA